MSVHVLPFRLSRAQALKLIREAADDTGRIILTPHAEQRMRQRRITMTQVTVCLRKGVITDGPRWIEPSIAGDDVKVALAIDPGARVIIITVM